MIANSENLVGRRDSQAETPAANVAESAQNAILHDQQDSLKRAVWRRFQPFRLEFLRRANLVVPTGLEPATIG